MRVALSGEKRGGGRRRDRGEARGRRRGRKRLLKLLGWHPRRHTAVHVVIEETAGGRIHSEDPIGRGGRRGGWREDARHRRPCRGHRRHSLREMQDNMRRETVIKSKECTGRDCRRVETGEGVGKHAWKTQTHDTNTSIKTGVRGW